MQLADTHCHLDFDTFDDDREEVIQRAIDLGVERILVPGIDLETSRAAVKLAEKYTQIYAAVGIQPNSGNDWEAGTLAEIENMAAHPKVAAIGEIGLDYYWDKTPRDKQAHIFQAQLELAADAGLPVIIHNREATQDVLRILLDWQAGLAIRKIKLAEMPGVLHSYSGNIIQAQQVLSANFLVGITGPVTFKNAEELRMIVKELPLDKILVETDAPYLTPHPHRGKRNEPSYVRFVAEKIAELQDVPPERVSEQTSANARKLFNW